MKFSFYNKVNKNRKTNEKDLDTRRQSDDAKYTRENSKKIF